MNEREIHIKTACVIGRHSVAPGRHKQPTIGMGAGLVLSGLAILLAAGAGAIAESYSITSFSIDGGGGKSTGGVFSVNGSIGQHDAGPALKNELYILVGGFLAVQTPDAPYLIIEYAGPGQSTISWDPDSLGWLLQQTPGLFPANWVDAPSGPTNPVTIPNSQVNRFYRLIKP